MRRGLGTASSVLARRSTVALLLTLVGACDDKAGTSVGNPPSSLAFALTDQSPPGGMDAYTNAFVDLSRIDVHRAGETDGGITDDEAGWIRITQPERRIDLLTLRGGTLDLGGGMLEAGAYQRIRLVVTGGEVVVQGQTSPLDIPSGSTSGIKVAYSFELEAGIATTLTLDVDSRASIRMNASGYSLQPQLRVSDRSDEPLGP